jgi:hypothetical protein
MFWYSLETVSCDEKETCSMLNITQIWWNEAKSKQSLDWYIVEDMFASLPATLLKTSHVNIHALPVGQMKILYSYLFQCYVTVNENR